MSTEIEILPPERSRRLPTRAGALVASHPRPVGAMFPGSPVPSGHWWAFIISRGNAFQGNAPAGYVEFMLNGQTLQFPIGVWAVIDDDKFHVAKESDLPMVWFFGDTLMEKTFEMRERRNGIPLRVIGQTPVRRERAAELLERTGGLLAPP